MTCTKIPYESLSAAHAALRALKRRRGSAKVECAVHPCAEHHAFHVTSKKASTRNRWTRKRRE